jgi:hypothetical protein
MAKNPKDIKDEALKFVLKAYEVYSNRKDLENKWIKYDKIYNSIPDDKEKSKLRENAGLADLFPPAARRCVRALLNFCDEALWAQSPSFKLKGVGGKGDDKRAEINTRILQLQMEKIGFRVKLLKHLENQIKFGFGIAKVPYIKKKKYYFQGRQRPPILEIMKNILMGQSLNKDSAVVYDNIDFIALSPFNVYWDYTRVWAEQEAVIEKISEVCESDLRILAKTYPQHYFGIEEYLSNFENQEGFKDSERENVLDILPHTNEMTGLSGSFSIKKKTHELLECWCNFDIDGDGIDEECIIVIIDRKQVIRMELNPYDLQEKPYLFSKWEDIEGAASLGMGVCQLAEKSQEALNTFTNQLMDDMIMILDNMWLVDEQAVQSTDQLKSRPRGIIKILSGANISNAIMPLRPPDVSTAAIKAIAMIKDDIYQVTGATVSLQGLPARYDTTATESRQMGDSAQRDIFVKLRSLEDNIIKQFLRRAYSYNLQYLDTDTIKKIVGIDAFEGYLQENGKDVLSYKDISEVIKDDYDFIPLGITEIENKIIKGQQAMNLFNIALKSPPGIWNYKALAKLIVKYIGDNDLSILADEIDETLIAPKDENILLEQGEKPSAKPIENHIEHIQMHQQAVLPLNFAKLRDEHIKQHERLYQIQLMQQQQMLQQQFMAQQAQLAKGKGEGMPPQEQPVFAPKGITPEQAGQVPGMAYPPVSLGGDLGQV